MTRIPRPRNPGPPSARPRACSGVLPRQLALDDGPIQSLRGFYFHEPLSAVGHFHQEIRHDVAATRALLGAGAFGIGTDYRIREPNTFRWSGLRPPVNPGSRPVHRLIPEPGFRLYPNCAPSPLRGDWWRKRGDYPCRTLRIRAIRFTSGQRRHGVRPGLDLRADGIIRVRGEVEAVAGDRHHEELAIGVPAAERCRVGVAPEVPDR